MTGEFSPTKLGGSTITAASGFLCSSSSSSRVKYMGVREEQAALHRGYATDTFIKVTHLNFAYWTQKVSKQQRFVGSCLQSFKLPQQHLVCCWRTGRSGEGLEAERRLCLLEEKML